MAKTYHRKLNRPINIDLRGVFIHCMYTGVRLIKAVSIDLRGVFIPGPEMIVVCNINFN